MLVQPSAYGRDNRAMIDALTREPERLRGVAVGGEELTPAILRAWHACGVRALRANEFRRDGKPYYQNGVRLRDIEHLLPAMADLGWHLQLWIDARDLPDLAPALARVPVPVVVDHMGRMDHRNGTHHPGFQELVRGVGEGRLWSKVSGTYRLGATPPDYAEATTVPRRACCSQSSQSGVGQRLAASAAGGAGAGCRAALASVSRLDAAGRG